jgi:uncharacterized repeat protein (TIGR03803 family)
MKGFKSFLTLSFALACAALSFSLAVRAQAQTVTNLANFNRETGDGPFGSVIQATNGRFYGVTVAGGFYRQGNVFELTPGGELRDVYSFCAKPLKGECADGASAIWAPVLASDGNLYGVTATGGSNAGDYNGDDDPGSGTIYKLTLGGKLTTLYTFCPSTPCIDGQGPTGLIQGSDGNFYGTTTTGGRFKEGAIFKITSEGKYTELYSFCSQANCADGERPVFPPLQGIDGNFYGATNTGGSTGAGVVYKLTASGTYTVLYNFCSYGSGPCPGGSVPTNIVQDASGNLFGTTQFGGSSETGDNAGYGVVFEITPTNQYIVLQSFNITQGSALGGLMIANDGNLYATTIGNQFGANGGNIVEISRQGVATLIYTFGECGSTGYNPVSTLFQGTDGTLYGMTAYGGDGTFDGGCGGYGTIYSVSNGLSPLVETSPVAGKAGESVIILGNGLTGTSSVAFNGVTAAFTVKSDTYIKATVPAGATTGVVSVVTPSGTLKSNPQFVVTK